jgi:hypothetical protein
MRAVPYSRLGDDAQPEVTPAPRRGSSAICGSGIALSSTTSFRTPLVPKEGTRDPAATPRLFDAIAAKPEPTKCKPTPLSGCQCHTQRKQAADTRATPALQGVGVYIKQTAVC